jgi:hypothetical protein
MGAICVPSLLVADNEYRVVERLQQNEKTFCGSLITAT